MKCGRQSLAIMRSLERFPLMFFCRDRKNGGKNIARMRLPRLRTLLSQPALVRRCLNESLRALSRRDSGLLCLRLRLVKLSIRS